MKDEYSEFWQALTVFCTKYDPADENTVTDYFSSKEIQQLVESHVGIEIDLPVLYELLIEMKYKYILQDDQFMWMVKK